MQKSSIVSAFILLIAGTIGMVPAFGDPIIISETSGGSPLSSAAIENFPAGANNDVQFGAASFTIAGAYTDVAVSVIVGCVYCSGSENVSISAYLTTAIGPSETVADQIATSTIAVPAGQFVDTAFSGLSLGPGTYYLALAAPTPQTNIAYWFGSEDGTAITTDSGVTFDGDYFSDYFFPGTLDAINETNPPASSFTFFGEPVDAGLNFDVTGDPASVIPEPSSFLLLASGLAGLAGMVKHKRRRT
jgi:hypothetical protein